MKGHFLKKKVSEAKVQKIIATRKLRLAKENRYRQETELYDNTERRLRPWQKKALDEIHEMGERLKLANKKHKNRQKVDKYLKDNEPPKEIRARYA